MFPGRVERTRALAAWSATAAAGGAAGSLVGGVLTEYLSWRWILLINVPIGVTVIALAVYLDLPGAVLATGSLTAIVYGVVHAPTHGWTDLQTIGSLALGFVALAVFIVVEARLASVLASGQVILNSTSRASS